VRSTASSAATVPQKQFVCYNLPFKPKFVYELELKTLTNQADYFPVTMVLVWFRGMPEIVWVCFPNCRWRAGGVHPLRPDGSAPQRSVAPAQAANFNSIAEVIAVT